MVVACCNGVDYTSIVGGLLLRHVVLSAHFLSNKSGNDGVAGTKGFHLTYDDRVRRMGLD